MSVLLDANVLLRVVNKNDPLPQVSLAAIRPLRTRKEPLYYTPQVLAEFWNVRTRPASARDGFGLSFVETERGATIIEHYLDLLPEDLATYLEWRRLVVAHTVSRAAVHDARLVASMQAYCVTHLVTFNVGDFRRYQDISVVTPQTLVSQDS